MMARGLGPSYSGVRTVSRVETIERLLAYDRTVFDRFERSVRRRGWRAATANREIAHRSFKDTLVHILNVREAWLVGVAQGRWEVFEDPTRRADRVGSWRDLRRYSTRVWSEADRFTATLTERSLSRRVRAPWMPGRYTLEDAFYQASFEQAHHLGEIIGAYWQSDRSPPAMTWIENAPRR